MVDYTYMGYPKKFPPITLDQALVWFIQTCHQAVKPSCLDQTQGEVEQAYRLFEQVSFKKLYLLLPVAQYPLCIKKLSMVFTLFIQQMPLSKSTTQKMMMLGMQIFSDQQLNELLQKSHELAHTPYHRTRTSQLKTYQPNPNLKIAVCVSGQLRDYQRAFASWEHLQLQDHQVDYYVHTWRATGMRLPNRAQHANRALSGRFLEAYTLVIKTYGFATLETLYPHFIQTLRYYGQVSLEQVQQVYGQQALVTIEDDDLFATLSNQHKMLYKIQACYASIPDPQQYDLIIRIRPDLVIQPAKTRVSWPDIWLYCQKYHALLTNGQGSTVGNLGFVINDQLSISTPKIAGIYAHTYRDRACNPALTHEMAFPLLGAQMYTHGIRVHQTPALYHAELADLAPLSATEIHPLIMQDLVARPRHPIDELLLAALQAD